MDRNSPPQACASCHEEIPPRARFCPFCGAAAPNAAPRAEDGGEHRQLTVMFCDLMGSTVLSHELEAEDLQDVLRTYQAICARAIESRAGMIAKYQGDGVMAYFGFPQATEDSPIRAVEAALEIVREVGRVGATLQTRDGIDFATRIALHTGRVLIGEMGAGGTRERHALTGIVPNLAARLEGVAPRNGVVISSQTHAMVTRAFRTESLGPQMLKGFAGPVEAHRVLGRRAALAVLPARSAPVVGREAELAVLRNCWQRTAAGEITRIAVIAEPGAGKSALATAFLSDSEIEQGRVIEFSGTLSDANTPFAALRQTIERWTAFAQMRSAELPQTQIAKWFGHESIAESPHANTFHRLWQGPMEPGSEGRAQIFDACRTLLGALPKPLLVVIEDAHWLDPSSFEMLDSISAQTPGMMVLLLSRPGHAATAKAENVIRLDSLDSDACRALVEQVAGAPVESGLLRRIIDVANGLPLFIEEYTKSLLEAGKIREERGTVRPTDLRTEIVTPASLLDLITMRLDSLGPVKQVAQIGATLGRSFSQEALAAVAGESEEAIENAVTRLTGSGLLSRDWSGRLTFDHALFQKVAYESLVRAARQKWHARYIDWLAARPNRMKSVPPETIGFHLEACGRPLEAVMHYLEAGLSANAASASLEAAVHFGKCCDLLHRVPPEDTPDALPLRAQVLLAGALLSARGPGADETRAAYDRAVTLAEETSESEWHFAAYWGWWRVSESFAQMNERAGRLLRISESMRGQEFRLQSLHCVWANAFQMGAFGTSIENAHEGLALYDEGRFEDIGTLYGGHDCKVCAHGEIALASWLQGAGDGATGELRTALDHAEHLDHLGSLLHGLDIAVMLHHYRRDTGAVREIADRLRDLGARNDLEDYRAKGEIFAGWVDIEAGQVRQGLGRVDEGFETLRAIGTPEDFPVYQCIRAVALTRLGDHDGALAVLADGRAIVATEGVNYWGAELARNEALVEMARRDPDPGFIEARLQEALSLAAAQGALALELRAAISLFSWKRERGDAAEARRTLAAVRARFDSAATGADLAAADALLAAPASQHAR